MSFLTSVLLSASIASMPNVDTARVKGDARKDSIERLPFTHPSTDQRRGYYFIPSGASSKGMPVLLLFHGFKDNGWNLVNWFRPFATRYKFALVAPDSAGEQWQVPGKGQYSIDTVHARDSLAWATKAIGKVDESHIGAFGHSFGARMSSTFGTNMSPITKTMISHGRFIPSSLGGHKTALWMSGSPKDNQFSFKVMQEQVKQYNSTYRKYWPGGGARLHTYDCKECMHPARYEELRDVTEWFLK